MGPVGPADERPVGWIWRGKTPLAIGGSLLAALTAFDGLICSMDGRSSPGPVWIVLVVLVTTSSALIAWRGNHGFATARAERSDLCLSRIIWGVSGVFVYLVFCVGIFFSTWGHWFLYDFTDLFGLWLMWRLPALSLIIGRFRSVRASTIWGVVFAGVLWLPMRFLTPAGAGGIGSSLPALISCVLAFIGMSLAIKPPRRWTARQQQRPR